MNEPNNPGEGGVTFEGPPAVPKIPEAKQPLTDYADDSFGVADQKISRGNRGMFLVFIALLVIGGIVTVLWYRDKTDFEKFLFGNKNFAEIIIYSESPLDNNNKLNKIKLDIKDITFRLDKRKTFKKAKGSILVYHGSSCNGLFDCIFPLDEDFDPTKLVLNYQYLVDCGYIISSAEYDGDKDDFCFHDGEFISNFELRFE